MMPAMRIMNMNTLTMSSIGICESFLPNSVYTQCVRWKRKPIWLPTAKSKVFRVPKRPVIPIEDTLELQRLYNNYRTYMNSLRSHINKIAEANKMQLKIESAKKSEEDDFNVCKVLNDKWNAEVAKIREARLEKEREIHKERALENMLKEKKKQEKLMKEVDKTIRKAKLDSLTFITAENVDEAIEECLKNVVDHNRALDLKGNLHDATSLAMQTVENVKSATVEQQSEV